MGVSLAFVVHWALIGESVVLFTDLLAAGIGAFFAASRLKIG